jgi:hypothetical protein
MWKRNPALWRSLGSAPEIADEHGKSAFRRHEMKLTLAFRSIAIGLLLLVIPAALVSHATAQIGIGIGVSVRIGPPALPVYEQPFCPGPGYLWTPGYWAWDDDDGYYWVTGTWVVAPVGLLWTPGYWGWNDGVYAWNAGYWGPHIGFYGGINYGFGYGGVGFFGGEWRGGSFFYNTAVMRVNTVNITNVYVNKTVIVNNTSHVAFNGGAGGVTARPTAQEIEYSHETHTAPVAAQVQQQHAASQNRALFASANHGRPAVAATAKPGEFSGKGVIAAKSAGGAYHAPAMSPKEARASAPAGNRESARSEARPASNSGAMKRENNGGRPASEPKNNAMKNNRPENENKGGNMAHESHPAKPSASHPASHAESKPAEKSRPAGESHAESRPPAEKSRPASEPRAESKPKSEPRAESKPAPRPSAPKENAPRESAPKESAPKPSHQAAPKPAPAKPASEPKEHK